MKIETGHKQIMEEYRKCVNHNLLQDYYNKTQQHYDFYVGNQWRGVYAPDLDKPVINFIRRVSQFLTAMIAGEEIGLFVTPYTAVKTGYAGAGALLHDDLILSNCTCDDSPSK